MVPCRPYSLPPPPRLARSRAAAGNPATHSLLPFHSPRSAPITTVGKEPMVLVENPLGPERTSVSPRTGGFHGRSHHRRHDVTGAMPKTRFELCQREGPAFTAEARSPLSERLPGTLLCEPVGIRLFAAAITCFGAARPHNFIVLRSNS